MSSSSIMAYHLEVSGLVISNFIEGSFIIRRLASRNPLVSTQTATCQVRIFRIAPGVPIPVHPTPYTGSVRIDSEAHGIILPGVALVGADGTSAGLSEIVEFKVAAALDYRFVYLPTAEDITAGVRLRVELYV